MGNSRPPGNTTGELTGELTGNSAPADQPGRDATLPQRRHNRACAASSRRIAASGGARPGHAA
jgi:hypothetical protein